MLTTDDELTNSGITIKALFSELTRRYRESVLMSESSADQETAARTLIPRFERLWSMMGVMGVVSPNEQLDDISTSGLELMWTPYLIADLYQRLQGPMPTPGATPAVAGGGVITREEALASSQRWFEVFFHWAQECELVDERTLDTYRTYRAEQRTQRVELSRKRRELEETMRRAEDAVDYLSAKRRHMQELLAEDGEDLGESGGEEEEALRNRAIARLKWSIYEACHQLQLSSRELEMLLTLSPEKRQEIAENHQKTIEAVRRGELSLGRHTYTILPGGLIAPGGPFKTSPLDSASLSAMGGQEIFRQKVVDELMIDRNKPTMTLAEFADAEMADVQRRMEANAEAQRLQEEEDERLGPDGVEERQRQRSAALADWKDDHAPIGQTSRGNYA
uniref:TAP42-like protein n=1 Tax=Trypanosoma congolense (strain IL3000) TaxID=1068625 RepID=G0UJS2_TRYCI|nr:conserved hypothetical protein [Trypanosoma congolense IL3000]